jgi:radical SAM protein with 4Fe4S-binding SPASM domain
MRCLAPDYAETRGGRVLLVWGDLPFWMIVDAQAARLITGLSEGRPLGDALRHAAGREPDRGLLREAAGVLGRLRQAGVVGRRRLRLPRERIESISVNVTNRCNLACSFCYNRGRQVGGAELTAAEFVAALESARRGVAGGAALALLGGEPLLEKEKTLALAAWAIRRGLKPIVSTNGLLVDPAFAREAAEVGLECQVSLDGVDAAEHEAIRGAGTHARALEAARVLIDAGAHTILSMVCHAGNWRQVPAYLRLARDLGAAEARFIALKRIGGGTGLDTPDLTRLSDLVLETVAREPELGALLGRDHVSILAATCRQCSRRQSCGAGGQTYLLDADGTVYPCINLAGPEFAAGNVRERSLVAILRTSPVLADVRQRVSLASRLECQGCYARHWCMGVCRGETYSQTGDLSGRSVTCEANRATIVQMLWALGARPGLGARGHVHHTG